MRRRGALKVGFLAALALACVGSCRTPTDVTLKITTDIPCTDVGSTTITVGSATALEAAAVTTSTVTCDSGLIGTLVILPSGSDDDSVAMKVVSGYKRRAEQCTPPDYKGCVVARRSLRYVSHRELTVVVAMSRDCIDVPCGADQTCVNARCVGAAIPDTSSCESPDGCGEGALAGADGGAGSDGGPDATLEDGAVADAGTPEGSTDGGSSIDSSIDAAVCASAASTCVGRTVVDCVGGQPVASADGPCPVACSNGKCVTVRTIAAGNKHTCATLSDGSIRCWGDNASQQLGLATAQNPSAAPVEAVSAVPRQAGNTVLAGGDVTCNVRPGGTIDCWGSNAQGQLGVAPTTTAASADPKTIANVTLTAPGATVLPTLAIGTGHVCAANADGGVFCWGDNGAHQLGSDAGSPVLAPALVGGVTGIGVAAGRSHSCAVNGAGNIYCWGDNTFNQLARGSGSEGGQFPSPQLVSGLTNPDLVFSGAGADHSISIATNLKSDCWGRNDNGQCGTMFVSFDDPVPTATKGVASACPVSFAIGPNHSCMLNAVACGSHPGEVDCTGANDAGQLGRGNTTDDKVFGPAQLGALGKGIWLSAGAMHACAVLDTGGAACWGANDRGQLGNGTVGGASSTPSLVVF